MEQSLIAIVTPMNAMVIVAVTLLAASIGVALYRVAMGSAGGWSASSGKPAIEPLDMRAFNNLVDPSEEDYLRQELPLSVFRTLQRMRLRAAIDYVRCASRNAALLIQMNRALTPDAHEQYSREASELVTAAVHLRMVSILVLCLLWIKIAFPGLRLSLKEVSALHERMISKHASLARFRGSGRILGNS